VGTNWGQIGECALVRAAQRGDRTACDHLVREHQRYIRARVAAHVDAADVDDVAQEVWAATIRVLPTFRGECAFRTWLTAIADHKTVVWYRRRAIAEPIGLPTACADPNGEFDIELEHAEARRRARRLLARLPAHQRRVLVLRWEVELPWAEVAARMALSEDAAKSLARRAASACRREGAGCGAASA